MVSPPDIYHVIYVFKEKLHGIKCDLWDPDHFTKTYDRKPASIKLVTLCHDILSLGYWSELQYFHAKFRWNLLRTEEKEQLLSVFFVYWSAKVTTRTRIFLTIGYIWIRKDNVRLKKNTTVMWTLSKPHARLCLFVLQSDPLLRIGTSAPVCWSNISDNKP